MLVLHSAQGNWAERLAWALLAAQRTVPTPTDAANAALVARGAVAVESWAAYAAARAKGAEREAAEC